jgi:hypothetical protein
VVVNRLRDLADPDGSDADELPTGARDARRDLQLHRTIDGLWALKGMLDALTGEKLAGLLDALSSVEGEGGAADVGATDGEPPRSPGQRRHDAFDALLDRAQASADLPTVHGRPPHVLAMIDLLALARLRGALPDLVDDDRQVARLRYTGAVSPELVLRLLRDAAVTVVTTAGPWRPVDVGRRMRTLPAYLRDVLQLLHQRCRGPDCDRWVTWAQAHHLTPWIDGGATDLNATIPVCSAHHRLCDHGWTAALDTATGVVTWTSPAGRVLVNRP